MTEKTKALVPSRAVLDEQAKQAKLRLGENWVHHPRYVPQARHSFLPDVYGPAREPYLQQIRDAAAASRATRQQRMGGRAGQ